MLFLGERDFCHEKSWSSLIQQGFSVDLSRELRYERGEAPLVLVSPVSVLRINAGSPIKAGITGVGGAALMSHFSGGTTTDGRGRHLYWD